MIIIIIITTMMMIIIIIIISMSSFAGVANLHTMSVSFPVSVGMHQFGLKYRRKARPLLNKMPPLHNLSFMALKQPHISVLYNFDL